MQTPKFGRGYLFRANTRIVLGGYSRTKTDIAARDGIT